MPDMKFLRRNVRGIKGVILSRNGEVLDADTEPDIDGKFLSTNTFYLVDFIRSMDKDVRKVSISGNSQFIIFIQDTLMLGVTAEKDINAPLLNVVAKQILECKER